MALKRRESVRQRLETLPLDAPRLSAIVLGALEFGAEKTRTVNVSARAWQPLPRVCRLLASIRSLPTREYARIRALLERQGVPIGANDTWIAAQAVAIGATFATDNEREFTRVPGLMLENWLVIK